MIATRRLVWGVVAAVLLEGCFHYQPVAPHEVASASADEWLIVRTVDTDAIKLRRVTLDSTSFSGVTEDGATLVIPIERVESVQLEEQDITLALAIIPVVAIAAWLQHGANTAPPPPPSSSCPFVYAYDGDRFVFQAEPYGGAIVPALKRTEWTPLPAIRPVDGEYRLRIANELDETQYIDEARLLVVDHPAGTQVAADPYGEVHLFRDLVSPRTATDSRGRDLLEILSETDRRTWASDYDGMDERARETLRDPLIVEFPKPADARTVRLLINGATSLWGSQVAREFLALRGSGLSEWYAELNQAESALMDLVDWFAREGLYVLPIEVETPTGWDTRGALYGSGPLAYKTTSYSVDVADIPGETLRIRLPVPVNFWVLNSVAAEYGDSPGVDGVEVETSTLHDAQGRDTRALLSRIDDRALVISDIGDHTELAYPAPAQQPGTERTVFLKISGYYDIHLSAEGEPQMAVVRRMMEEPGYTLRFAFERYRRGLLSARPLGSP